MKIMLKILKVVVLVILAILSLVGLRKKVTSVPTFQWLMKIVLAATTVLILGILMGVF
jgi:hypothetical protein